MAEPDDRYKGYIAEPPSQRRADSSNDAPQTNQYPGLAVGLTIAFICISLCCGGGLLWAFLTIADDRPIPEEDARARVTKALGPEILEGATYHADIDTMGYQEIYRFTLSNPEDLSYQEFCEAQNESLRSGRAVYTENHFDEYSGETYPTCRFEPHLYEILNWGDESFVLSSRFPD